MSRSGKSTNSKMTAPNDPRVDAAIAAARAAGEVARRYFGGAELAIEWKGGRAAGSPVTRADRDAESAAKEVIAARFPDHGFLGEEHGESGDRARRWIIDPIDGTANFIRGIPFFGALVALEEEGRIIAAAAYNPILGELAWALRGAGVFLNGVRMRVSDATSLAEATVAYSSAGAFLRRGMGGISRLLAAAGRDRGFGDYYGYLLVASARAEVMLDAHTAPWDLAAPKLLVEEAGGRLTGLDGTDSIYGDGAIASNGALHDSVLTLLRSMEDT